MKTILIIEDNADVRENAAEILELSNYNVLTAENGKTGVELALEKHPDLIVCDIMMPVLDGYGVLHLLSKHKETSAIPFIFLTAKSEKNDVRKGMELGADDYLTKPFDGIELLNAVETRLKKAEQVKQTYTAEIKKLKDILEEAQSHSNIKLTSNEREVETFQKGHNLYHEGQRPKEVFYIVSGKVKVYKTHSDGKNFITAIYGPGEFLGYTPILEESNYKENAQVLEDAEIMTIPRDDFMQLLTHNKQTAQQFIKLIAHEKTEREEALVNLAYNSLRKKVAYGMAQLLDKYKQNDGTYVLDLSRETLAHTIGVATESLIRTLADFKEEKIIEIQKGKIYILNEQKLKNLPF
jgi:DNA-binding response OmpR family regulator